MRSVVSVRLSVSTLPLYLLNRLTLDDIGILLVYGSRPQFARNWKSRSWVDKELNNDYPGWQRGRSDLDPRSRTVYWHLRGRVDKVDDERRDAEKKHEYHLRHIWYKYRLSRDGIDDQPSTVAGVIDLVDRRQSTLSQKVSDCVELSWQYAAMIMRGKIF